MMKNRINCLLCNLKAIPFWLMTGVFEPHTFSDIIEHNKDIFVTESGDVRLADSFMRPEEMLVRNATIKTCVCVHCGKVEHRWIRNGGKK